MKKLVTIFLVAVLAIPAYGESNLYVLGAMSIYDGNFDKQKGIDFNYHLVGSGTGYQVGMGVQVNKVLGFEFMYDRAPKITDAEAHMVFGTEPGWLKVVSKRNHYLSFMATGSYYLSSSQNLRLIGKAGYSHYWQRFNLKLPTFTGFLIEKQKANEGVLRFSIGIQWPLAKTNTEIEVYFNNLRGENVKESWVSFGFRYRI